MGKKLTVGLNDLATTHPELASEWDVERNFPLHAHDVFAGTNRKHYWLCPKGHTYEATGTHRLAGRGCPYCSGNKVLAGFNDLATTHPELASEWDFDRNAPLTPSDVSAGANKTISGCAQKGTRMKQSQTIGKGATLVLIVQAEGFWLVLMTLLLLILNWLVSGILTVMPH